MAISRSTEAWIRSLPATPAPAPTAPAPTYALVPGAVAYFQSRSGGLGHFVRHVPETGGLTCTCPGHGRCWAIKECRAVPMPVSPTAAVLVKAGLSRDDARLLAAELIAYADGPEVR